MESLTTFSLEDIQGTQPAMKVGLLATVTPEGLPHVTLISSVMACSPQQVCFGQFTEGISKHNILENPHAGFLMMSLDKQMWRGKARYTHLVKEGPEFEYYNNVPMFRYNAYFGIHTVYYLDLISHTGRRPLPMGRVVIAAIQTILARTLGRKRGSRPVINQWTQRFLNQLDCLKFLAYVGPDGYPEIIPAIQAQTLDSEHVLFSTSVYRDELEQIPAGAELCVFGMGLTMEDVLLRGKYQGIRRIGGVKSGLVQVDWVYNPMPPIPGQIYPLVELEPVKEF